VDCPGDRRGTVPDSHRAPGRPRIRLTLNLNSSLQRGPIEVRHASHLLAEIAPELRDDRLGAGEATAAQQDEDPLAGLFEEVHVARNIHLVVAGVGARVGGHHEPISGPDAEAVGHRDTEREHHRIDVSGMPDLRWTHADPHRLRSKLRGAAADADAAHALRASGPATGAAVAEWIVVEPAIAVESFVDWFGNRAARILAPAGLLRIRYDNVIDDSGRHDVPIEGLRLTPVHEMPAECWRYLFASRYCEVDRMVQVAWDLFWKTPESWQRVQAMLAWSTATSPSATSSRGRRRPPSTSSTGGP